MKLKPAAQIVGPYKLTDRHKRAEILGHGLLLPDDTLLCSLPEAEEIIKNLEAEISKLKCNYGGSGEH